MQGSQPIRFLIILPEDEGGQALHGEVKLEHIAPAYFVFKDSGAEVVLASATGGHPERTDFRSSPNDSHFVHRFLRDRSARDDLSDTLDLDQIVADDFDAALCLGFSGSRWSNDGSRVAFLLKALLDNGRAVALIPGSDVDLAPQGAGCGLLMIGETDDAPTLMAHALLKMVMERRSGS